MFHRLSSKIVCLLCVCLFVGPKIMKFGTLVPFVNTPSLFFLILVISGVKAPLLFSLYISFFNHCEHTKKDRGKKSYLDHCLG